MDFEDFEAQKFQHHICHFAAAMSPTGSMVAADLWQIHPAHPKQRLCGCCVILLVTLFNRLEDGQFSNSWLKGQLLVIHPCFAVEISEYG